jgi:ATP-dependent Clp protease adaptor protein ClpS
VCTYGSNRALLGGPSTSPLGAPVESSQYSAPISRPLVVAVGTVVMVMALALVAVIGFVIYRMVTVGLPSSQALVVLCLVGALGLALCVVGLRLLTGRRRRDGGLFSPWALRFGGFIFLLGPVAAIVNRSWFGLFEAGVGLSAGIACFVLANRREQAAAGLLGVVTPMSTVFPSDTSLLSRPEFVPAGFGYGVEILNDNGTPMEFVVSVLQAHLGLTRLDAARSMLAIHSRGGALFPLPSQAEAHRIAEAVTAETAAQKYPLVCRAVDVAGQDAHPAVKTSRI